MVVIESPRGRDLHRDVISHVEGDFSKMAWLATALKQGTAVMVTDGSFNKSLAPDISGAGWMIACTTRRKMLNGWFYERSLKAGSYHGELLESVAVHLIAALLLLITTPPPVQESFSVTIRVRSNRHQNHFRGYALVSNMRICSERSVIKARCPMTFCYSRVVRARRDEQLP